MPKVTAAHVEARRSQILEAACKCFSNNGFHRTTVRDICEQAALSAGAVYGYFKSKEEIIEALAAVGRKSTRDFIESARTDEEAPLSVSRILSAVVGFLNSDKAVMSNRLDLRLWGEALNTPQIQKLFLEGFEDMCDLFAEIIRGGQERGEIDGKLDPGSVARLFVALCLGLIVQKAIDPDAELTGCSDVIASLFEGRFKIKTH